MDARIIRKTLFASLLILVGAASARAESRTPAQWHDEFRALTPGIPRLQAEKEIERIRRVKSVYDLWAMDTSPTVAYRLDPETILLVSYRPGFPAPRTTNGHDVGGPIDGTLIEFQILPLR